MTLDDLLTNCRQLVTQRMKSPFFHQQCDSIVCPKLLVLKLKLSVRQMVFDYVNLLF